MDTSGIAQKKSLEDFVKSRDTKIKEMQQEELRKILNEKKQISGMNIALSCRIGLAIHNKTRKWLANCLGVSNTFSTLLCNGDKNPNADMIKRISAVFNVSVSEFISWGEKFDTY